MAIATVVSWSLGQGHIKIDVTETKARFSSSDYLSPDKSRRRPPRTPKKGDRIYFLGTIRSKNGTCVIEWCFEEELSPNKSDDLAKDDAAPEERTLLVQIRRLKRLHPDELEQGDFGIWKSRVLPTATSKGTGSSFNWWTVVIYRPSTNSLYQIRLDDSGDESSKPAIELEFEPPPRRLILRY